MNSIPAPSSYSLRNRLVAGTLLIVAVIWAGVSYTAWREALNESDQIFDAHLAQSADIIVGLVGNEPDEIASHLPTQRYQRALVFQVWANGETLLARSSAAPAKRLTTVDNGFSDSESGDGGRQWRVFSAWDAEHKYLVQVAESNEARRAVSHELAEHLLYPFAVALLLLAIALVLTIRAGLAPLLALAQGIGQRSPDRLDAIALNDTPRELQPVLEQLNRLMMRVQMSLDTERRFTADAAHELRTPLAAIRAHAQIALQSRNDSERLRTLQLIVEASDHATRLTEQLLMLARLDSETPGKDFVDCDLQQLTVDAIAQTTPFAFDRSVELVLTEGAPIHLCGNPTLLTVMLRNLIDNAVRYSPRDSTVIVSATLLPDCGTKLEVRDQGPGIPAAEQQNVLNRFTRLDGSTQSGAGLGLSIVARVAEIHQATLQLETHAGQPGLCASVTFPASMAANRNPTT